MGGGGGFRSHNTKGLLPKREVCTVKYRTDVFSTDRASAASEVCTKITGVQYFSNYRTDRRNEVNKLFSIWLTNLSSRKNIFICYVRYYQGQNSLRNVLDFIYLSWLVNGNSIICVRFSFYLVKFG